MIIAPLHVQGSAQHTARQPSVAATSRLLRDQRGLSTLEYGLIFVLIVVGAIALWNKLGQSMQTQLSGGESTFSRALGNAQRGNTGSAAPAGTRQSVLANASSQASANATGSANSVAAASATSSGAQGSRASKSQSTAAANSSAKPAGGETQGARADRSQPSAAASGSAKPAEDGDWSSQKVGTGGKVAVVAAGAVAGAAMAAGTSIATAYVATLACGPGAPVCAGAVTAAIAVGLAGYGVHQLMNGGWSALKGSFSRVFSSDDATVGDALSVGTTLGAAAYGIGTTGLSGAAGTARGEAIATVGARAGAATRAEIASVLTGSTPELALAGVPNAAANPVPAIVRMSPIDEAASGESAAASGTATSPGGKPTAAKVATEDPAAVQAAEGASRLEKRPAASNRAQHEKYTDELRAGMGRPHVDDPALSKIMNDLYRPGAKVGSGSTAAAVRAEAQSGVAVGGRLHTQKAQESVQRIQKWLANNPTARPGDRAAAENVLRDLQIALGKR